MKLLSHLFRAGHFVILAFFVLCAAGLVTMAGLELWHGFTPGGDMVVRDRFNVVLEAVGLLTVALVTLELGQTIFEEEILRDVKVSGPTRVRRYLSRFFVVIVIALAIETLVSIFELMHADPAKLPYAAAVGSCAALLLIAWGVFVKLNRSAEELEPEAMAETKREDREVEE
ncbi:hypothetical protein CPBF426_38810 [Xanthomonas arboricola pv. juglandis]|uniref:Uncharacterized protein n=1 Tax=Xanthomonas euroxanthea TaxID=2259622 RepID=A0A6V7NAF7_9XANT|nr:MULTISPECIES: hypothetical protein [Xanthomonas]PPT29278.1 hypothetical protein XaCFBP7622_13895 [Xanthomonas arboricola]SYZ54815.1 hypothetical protein CPBF367_23000 [Xanthomonas arboricola pv. juglandis]MBB3780149.1 hypothetical protein [Xanthomonas euroxanthea]MBB3815011.1 hypothetical protein [Xanthomonas euroxanthea]MBB5769826.1 hypothetical protein [Xanthomonas euroxanthea]